MFGKKKIYFFKLKSIKEQKGVEHLKHVEVELSLWRNIKLTSLAYEV